MARPKKCRRVCHFPQNLSFSPDDAKEGTAEIILTVDEYETLRLIDKEGFSQETCSEMMGVARTTVQQIYASARKKLADMLVDGLRLRIEGGDFRLCDGISRSCGGCFKQDFSKPKGDNIMRIAVTYENGMVFQHFGHTKQFKVYDVTEGKVIFSEVIDTNGSGHGALAGVLTALNADTLICGGIGGGAQAALAAAGIKLYGGVTGSADMAVQSLLAGVLDFNPNVKCDHHDHEHHHEEGHTCGDHGCGSHSCGHH
ncbi:MAG: DUF134 domain-containing protein [Oscillospiraceae bacterium]|nr:DUF134 domain-containing protein [Oscillospiraceae bacterium]MBQ4538041.1 DUF134 domain-containing protein [Oscillospiraceae bacterium]